MSQNTTPRPKRFTTRFEASAVTPQALAHVSCLRFFEVTDSTVIPSETGVYVWANDWDGAVVYIGSGRGASGLAKRLGDERRWVRDHRKAVEERAEDWCGDRTTMEVPLLRYTAETGARLWAATVEPATFTVDCENPRYPETATEWEWFLLETARILTGYRCLIGGSGWEYKGNAAAMGETAWHRLANLHSDADPIDLGL